MLSSTVFDFDRFSRESKADTLPEHLLPEIAKRLNARIEQPHRDGKPALRDRLGALLYGAPQHWAMARRVLPDLASGDAVYAAGCDAGLPLALLCALRRRRVSFAIAFSDPERTRTKVLGWLLAVSSLRLTAFVTTGHQAELLNRSFGRRIDSVHVIEGQTDCKFFRPPASRPVNDPPLVVSGGVERRDYESMSLALQDADIEARISFASPNLDANTRYTMPARIPANFEFRPLDFSELRSLYQQADLLVLPLLENRYSAGLTSLFEAIACGTPIVVTESPGIIQELIDDQLVIGVPVGDAPAIRSAVEQILSDPSAARDRAERARSVILHRYSAARFLDFLEHNLMDFARPLAPL